MNDSGIVAYLEKMERVAKEVFEPKTSKGPSHMARQAAFWRIKAEEWEEKYKVAIETEGKKWERALDTWRTRYEDAIRRLDRCEAELRRAGGERDD